MNHSEKRTTITTKEMTTSVGKLGDAVAQMVKSSRVAGRDCRGSMLGGPLEEVVFTDQHFVRQDCELFGSWPASSSLTLQLICNFAASHLWKN